MKLLVAGVQRISGKAKKPPHGEYDFARLLVLSPIKPRSGTDYAVVGAGWEVQEMACEPSAVAQFLSFKFPGEVDVETEARPGAGGKGFEVWVIGVKKPVAA
jgi:hypothetical protein